MTITISEGVLVSSIAAFLGILGKVLWSVGQAVINSLASGDAARLTMVETQVKILDHLKGMAEAATSTKALDRLRRSIARSNPSLLFCDVCQGWEGPVGLGPAGVKACDCSDPPPKG